MSNQNEDLIITENEKSILINQEFNDLSLSLHDQSNASRLYDPTSQQITILWDFAKKDILEAVFDPTNTDSFSINNVQINNIDIQENHSRDNISNKSSQLKINPNHIEDIKKNDNYFESLQIPKIDEKNDQKLPKRRNSHKLSFIGKKKVICVEKIMNPIKNDVQTSNLSNSAQVDWPSDSENNEDVSQPQKVSIMEVPKKEQKLNQLPIDKTTNWNTNLRKQDQTDLDKKSQKVITSQTGAPLQKMNSLKMGISVDNKQSKGEVINKNQFHFFIEEKVEKRSKWKTNFNNIDQKEQKIKKLDSIQEIEKKKEASKFVLNLAQKSLVPKSLSIQKEANTTQNLQIRQNLQKIEEKKQIRLEVEAYSNKIVNYITKKFNAKNENQVKSLIALENNKKNAILNDNKSKKMPYSEEEIVI